MSSGKATMGITVVNSALGFFSSDFFFFFPLEFKPPISRTAVSPKKKWDRALELAQRPRPGPQKG